MDPIKITGAEMWNGELTDDKIQQIISGLLIPNQSMSVRIAYELLQAREVMANIHKEL